MRILATLVLLSLVLHAQEAAPEEPRKPTAGEIEIPDPAEPAKDSSAARREVAKFQTAWKAAKERGPRLAALEELGKTNHESVLKAATKPMKHRDYQVAVAAVVVCARQSSCKEKAGKALFSILKREKRTAVVCAALVGMGKLGYETKQSVKKATMFAEKDTSEIHKAAIRYLGYIKHKKSFRLIAMYLDEPAPKDPDDPANPPAEWWKKRWYEWKANLPYTRWALQQLVPDETFANSRDARLWAQDEGREHGIKW